MGKARKAAKPKAKPTHPKTTVMIVAAVKALKDREGSSLAAIKKYIAANYKVDTVKLAPFIKKGIKSLVAKKALIQIKGHFPSSRSPSSIRRTLKMNLVSNALQAF